MEAILAKALGQDVAQLATEEKQRLLSRLLERLAHEIRNPLSSLNIHLQLLEEDLPGFLREHDQNSTTFSVRSGMSLAEVEKLLIRQTLTHVTSNREEAAKVLGISR